MGVRRIKMSPIHIHTQLNSTTLHLPEILPLLGKRVEIIVQEEVSSEIPSGFIKGTGDWQGAQQAVEGLTDYDFDAVRELDASDLHDAARDLP
jgi:hypothetical protein